MNMRMIRVSAYIYSLWFRLRGAEESRHRFHGDDIGDSVSILAPSGYLGSNERKIYSVQSSEALLFDSTPKGKHLRRDIVLPANTSIIIAAIYAIAASAGSLFFSWFPTNSSSPFSPKTETLNPSFRRPRLFKHLINISQQHPFWQ